MPSKCCVPGCRGNYQPSKQHPLHEKVSIFHFPRNPEMRKKWVNLIPGSELIITKHTRICERHFSPQYIIRIDSAKRDDGTILSMPRLHPRLSPNAIPTCFPDTDASAKLSKQHKTKTNCLLHDEKKCNSLIAGSIISFYEVFNKIDQYLNDHSDWFVVKTDDCLIIVYSNEELQISTSIRINKCLDVEIYRNESKLDRTSLAQILSGCKLEYWSQLDRLLSHYKQDFPAVAVKLECAD